MNFRKKVVVLVLGLAISGCAGHYHHPQETRSYLSDVEAMNTKRVTITKPKTVSQHLGPVEVCMSVTGYTVEPAKNGVNEGKGHHHLLIDTPMPENLDRPLGKDANHVHMGDGSSCKTLTLGPGPHTVRAVFAKGNHVPYNPAVTDAITIYIGRHLK